MPDVRFDRYYRHPQLLELLEGYAIEHAGLVSVESIGRTHEGREIRLVTLTNRTTGAAADKPAFWIDGNIHATEVAASTACLYLLDHLVRRYGHDAEVTRLLDTRALYLCPRVNPDGAEWALADSPRIVRSSTRDWPYGEDPIEGLTIEDVDGNGLILQMRIADPNGLWKAHPDVPKLMVRREPTETGGTYYRVIQEGRYRDYDGFTLHVPRPRQGLDLNRNFPSAWRQEFEQLGSGPFPVSEPEVRALVEFFAAHPNINGAVTFHTYSGVLLRSFDHTPDTEMHPEDLWFYRMVGSKGTEWTGYPNISVYEEFRYHPKQVIGGTFDWIYEHLGMYCWCVELWSPMREAGITGYKFIDWFRDHPVEDDLKLVRWSDEVLGGAAFVDWKPFDHPDLGRVEIGGWNRLHAISNPPPQLLQREVERFPRWIVWQALMTPKLELVDASAAAAGPGVWKLRVVAQNTGWLPSYTSKRALERKVVRGLVAELALPQGAELVSGKRRVDVGQLEGKAYKHANLSFWPDSGVTDDRVKIEWVVRAKAGDSIAYTLTHERCGRIAGTIPLG